MSNSLLDTILHIQLVQQHMDEVLGDLTTRAFSHDYSKLNEPELSGYAGLSDALKGLTYGTPEHKAAFAPFKQVIDHHYAVNDHHPEHFKLGINGMNLLQLIEMVCDWKAASLRNSDTLADSLDVSFKRFGIDTQLANIIRNTVNELRW